MRRASLFAILAALTSATVTHAHHSFASYYFEDQLVTVAGELVTFEYRAPHAWVHVRARDSEGRIQTFAAEWANPNRLGRDGITRETLRPGDQVIVTGSPGRNAEEHKLHLKGIERPSDGWKWAPRRR